MKFDFKYRVNEKNKAALKHNSKVIRYVLNNTNLKLNRRKAILKVLKCLYELKENDVEFNEAAGSVIRSLDYAIDKGRIEILEDDILKSKKSKINLKEDENFLYEIDDEVYELKEKASKISKLQKKYEKWVIDTEIPPKFEEEEKAEVIPLEQPKAETKEQEVERNKETYEKLGSLLRQGMLFNYVWSLVKDVGRAKPEDLPLLKEKSESLLAELDTLGYESIYTPFVPKYKYKKEEEAVEETEPVEPELEVEAEEPVTGVGVQVSGATSINSAEEAPVEEEKAEEPEAEEVPKNIFKVDYVKEGLPELEHGEGKPFVIGDKEIGKIIEVTGTEATIELLKEEYAEDLLQMLDENQKD